MRMAFGIAGWLLAALPTWVLPGEASFGPAAVEPVGGGIAWLVAGTSCRAYVVEHLTGRRRLAIELPGPAVGAAVRGSTGYIAISEPAGRVVAVDLVGGRVVLTLRVGHMPAALALTPDAKTLCVANRFLDCVRLIDVHSGRQRIVGVVREPCALAPSPDGRHLFVANLLPFVEAALDDENPDIAAVVSVIDIAAARRVRDIRLPNGSHSVRGLVISPDGRYALVAHVLSNYMPPPLHVDGGAMNRNVLSLVDARTFEWINTVPLDDPDAGAANPWAVAFSGDGRWLLVTHAGTHELSVIDYASLMERMNRGPAVAGLFAAEALRTMSGIRRRVPLGLHGPRDLAVAGGLACISGFFSDSLAVVDLLATPPRVRLVRLGGTAKESPARLGERYFNDASLCRGRWQSCATCHPDGREDAMYWDLTNDGVGNFKTTRSLLMSALTPPAMWRGVRADAVAAIRAGIHHIHFTEPQPEHVEAIEAYLGEMKAVPGPGLNAEVPEPSRTNDASCTKCHAPGVRRGMLSEAARRGKALFEGKAGCAKCHPHPLYTTMKDADPGLGSGVRYDVPSLVEVWRTAPYLHNGEGTTLRETITDLNFAQKRGNTRDLSGQELEDLIEFLRSL